MAAERHQGSVKWFSNKKGYGFITPGEGAPQTEDIFVHQSSIHSDGYRTLDEGWVVEFTIGTDEDGKVKAENVTAPGGGPCTGARSSRRRRDSKREGEDGVKGGDEDGGEEEGGDGEDGTPDEAAPSSSGGGDGDRPRRSGRGGGRGGRSGGRGGRGGGRGAKGADGGGDGEGKGDGKNDGKNEGGGKSEGKSDGGGGKQGGGRGDADGEGGRGDGGRGRPRRSNSNRGGGGGSTGGGGSGSGDKAPSQPHWHASLNQDVMSALDTKGIRTTTGTIDVSVGGARIKLGTRGYSSMAHSDGVLGEGSFSFEPDGTVTFEWRKALSFDKEAKEWKVADTTTPELVTKLVLTDDAVIAVGADETPLTLWGDIPEPKTALENNDFEMRRVVLTPKQGGRNRGR